MRDLKLWKFILEKLERHQPVVLMCVVESSGSSPGRKGFKMAVCSDDMCGSIGGGIMEHKFVEMAKDRLFLHQDPLLKKQFHRKSDAHNQSGMICSGEQTVLMYKLQEDSIKAIKQLVSSLEENKNGRLMITADDLGFEAGNFNEGFSFKTANDQQFEYRETTGYVYHLYIVGGGHCALALSRLMHSLDFHIHVFEDRDGLNTMAQNDSAHKKTIVGNYSELKNLIPEGEKNYVVVMSFGYRTDDAAIRALAGKKFGFIGVLGSASKMQQLFSEWHAGGLPSEWLDKIYSPVGLQIKSETPGEIAVSIAAQIIQAKNMISPDMR
jgi:xanthine dehydrogenase accessory factor